MTNGKTTLEFSHSAPNAVEAAKDALTLAMAWLPEGSENRDTLDTIISDVRALHNRMKKAHVSPLAH